MQLDYCTHGNLAMTCPQCRGRLPATPFAAAHVERSAPAAAPPAGDDSIESLFDRVKSPDAKLNVLLGSSLERLIERSERKVEASSDREARQTKAFWQQVNEPTTRYEHERLRQGNPGADYS